MRTFRGMVLVVLAVLTPLFFAAPAHAQAKPAPQQQRGDTDQGVGIGVLAGIGSTSLRGDGAEGTSSGTGPLFGIWFGGNRNGRVGFMGEVNYVVKKITIDDEGADSSLSTKYIEIPAAFRINIGNKSRNGVSIYALAGPVFDFRLSSTLKLGGVEVPSSELENTFSSVDIGLFLGGGVEVNRIGFEVRVNTGMKQLATNEAVDSGDLPKAKSRSIQFAFKFRFN